MGLRKIRLKSFPSMHYLAAGFIASFLLNHVCALFEKKKEKKTTNVLMNVIDIQ